ncbi:phage holin family protein [Vallicoccus soli]|uniref:Phage holin family protein n=1 Tax=Vallicoccus soli TaxID=2339232 RepID=A0A3A3Z0E3_9ACTN|nr:phage holin family protein [Vallicoccus soli]RJK97719.1 phage holin family protein [Vallicoccus soli]
MDLLWRLAASALALWVAARLVDGVDVTATTDGGTVATVALVAVVFGVVNAVVKPVVKLLALPLYVLTLGLLTFVVNGLLLWLTGALAEALDIAFRVTGLWPAVLGALVVSVVSWAASLLVGD